MQKKKKTNNEILKRSIFQLDLEAKIYIVFQIKILLTEIILLYLPPHHGKKDFVSVYLILVNPLFHEGALTLCP